MSTKNPRINVTFEENVSNVLVDVGCSDEGRDEMDQRNLEDGKGVHLADGKMNRQSSGRNQPAAIIFGAWLERVGPRRAMFYAAVCFGLGFVIAATGVSTHQLWLVYFGYGIRHSKLAVHG